MREAKDSGRSGEELYQMVLAIEELLGSELTGQELRELVDAADPLQPSDLSHGRPEDRPED